MKIVQFDLEHPILCNRYMLLDEASGEAAIIDPAWYEGVLENEIKNLDKNVKIKYILLTHGHFDHIMGVYALKEATGALVAIHEADEDCLYDSSKSYSKDADMPAEQIPVHADILLKDGDELRLGETVIRVMHTPGHTLGSVCYIVEEEKTIFSGDTLFCMTVGRTDLYGGSMDMLGRSLRKLIALEGDYRVLAGHSRETNLERERTRNRFIRRMDI